jgi:hypothetical protein
MAATIPAMSRISQAEKHFMATKSYSLASGAVAPPTLSYGYNTYYLSSKHPHLPIEADLFDTRIIT